MTYSLGSHGTYSLGPYSGNLQSPATDFGSRYALKDPWTLGSLETVILSNPLFRVLCRQGVILEKSDRADGSIGQTD